MDLSTENNEAVPFVNGWSSRYQVKTAHLNAFLKTVFLSFLNAEPKR
jgi:hypothetical protein